jgi:CheY-like chemotaxis protein
MKKIMIVDDNVDIIYAVKTSLTDLDKGIRTIEATSGEECLKILPQEHPDIILMDIMMPGMDGMDTAIKIKEIPEYKNIPIIFLSAKTDKLSKGMGSIAGEDYVEKPFEAKDLYKRIIKVLEKSK